MIRCCLRISAGGTPKDVFYLRYRGDEEDIKQLLRIMVSSFDKALVAKREIKKSAEDPGAAKN